MSYCHSFNYSNCSDDYSPCISSQCFRIWWWQLFSAICHYRILLPSLKSKPLFSGYTPSSPPPLWSVVYRSLQRPWWSLSYMFLNVLAWLVSVGPLRGIWFRRWLINSHNLSILFPKSLNSHSWDVKGIMASQVTVSSTEVKFHSLNTTEQFIDILGSGNSIVSSEV